MSGSHIHQGAQGFELWRDGGVESGTAGDPRAVCRALEGGAILFFPDSPVAVPEADRAFLLGLNQLGGTNHKNLAYRPGRGRINTPELAPAEGERLRRILEAYSRDVTRFLQEFLSPYRGRWTIDYASFRPVEEEGRPARLRARNDLLHVDSFPTRPTGGDRILRFFTNVNPSQARIWHTTEPFERLVAQFRRDVKPFPSGRRRASRLRLKLQRALRMGAVARPAYDRWMLDFHNFLKEHEAFQQSCPKFRWAFPPGSSWMVYTDAVSHAVMSGRFALEQTFIVAEDALVAPESSPASILHRAYARDSAARLP